MAKKRKFEFDYAATFDRLMQEQFGEAFTTEWNLFASIAGGYITKRSDNRNITKTQALFGRGLSHGMAAYRDAALRASAGGETAMTDNVDIGREAVEQFCEFRIPEPVKDVLLAMRDALDKAEKETAFQLQRAATSEAEIAELKANELRLHQIIYKLSDKGKQADATIARQQRAIERKDAALQTAAEWMYDPDDANGVFERVNDLYMRDTGWMRPGKDYPAESYRNSCDDENSERFRAWCVEQQRKRLAVVREALTGTPE